MRDKAKYFAIVAIVALLDQLTKAWALRHLQGRMPMVLWRDLPSNQVWFELQFTTNTGAAWGIASKHTSLLALLSGVMILVIGWVLLNARKEERLLSVALSLMLGGAFGNLLDRVIHGFVTDFLHSYLPIGGITDWLATVLHSGALHAQVVKNMPGGIYDFPIFNVADSAVVVGTVCLLIALMRPAPEPHDGPVSAQGGTGDGGRFETVPPSTPRDTGGELQLPIAEGSAAERSASILAVPPAAAPEPITDLNGHQEPMAQVDAPLANE